MNSTYLFIWVCLAPIMICNAAVMAANKEMTRSSRQTSLQRVLSFPPAKRKGPKNCRTRAVRDLFQNESSPSRRTKRQVIDCDRLANNYANQGYMMGDVWGPTNSVSEVLLQQRTDLPLAVRAVVYHDHIDRPRTNFGASAAVTNRMTFMNRRPADEKGHIIASQLGGPAGSNALYNLAPQTAVVNRNVGNAGDDGWANLENLARSELNRDRCGHIEFLVVLNYDFAVNRRPTGFSVCFKSFDGQNREHVNIARYYNNN